MSVRNSTNACGWSAVSRAVRECKLHRHWFGDTRRFRDLRSVRLQESDVMHGDDDLVEPFAKRFGARIANFQLRRSLRGPEHEPGVRRCYCFEHRAGRIGPGEGAHPAADLDRAELRMLKRRPLPETFAADF